MKCICNRGKGLAVQRQCVYGGMGLLPYNLDRMGLDEEDYNNQNALNGSQVCGVLWRACAWGLRDTSANDG